MKDRKPSVLLIDDDLVYRYAAKKTIRSTGLAGKVEECTNGIDALKYLKENISVAENLPDIIFLDINMPAMDGWEFLSDYTSIERQIPKKIRIYIVSSSIDKSDISRSKEISTVTDYLIKPVFKEKFSEIFRSMSV